jgi:hypothetical protein
MRAFHPLRWQRWAVSDAFNPWLAWLGPAADAVRARRQAGATETQPPTDAGEAQRPAVPDLTAPWRMMTEHNPWLWWLRAQGQVATKKPASAGDADPARHLDRLVSETTSAALDYYRDVRDAMSEAAFFLTYGNLFSFYLADRSPADEHALPAAAADPRDLPFVKEALASLEQGGYAEALARVAALINRDTEQIPLARLELRRDLAEEYAEFLPAMPRARAGHAAQAAPRSRRARAGAHPDQAPARRRADPRPQPDRGRPRAGGEHSGRARTQGSPAAGGDSAKRLKRRSVAIRTAHAWNADPFSVALATV